MTAYLPSAMLEKHTAKVEPLPSVGRKTHGKGQAFGKSQKEKHMTKVKPLPNVGGEAHCKGRAFTECRRKDSWQKYLCRVSLMDTRKSSNARRYA